MLTAIGVEGFAERARRELLATGKNVRKRRIETTADLTAQEAQIARLARDGLSNPEISTQLFLSPRTVEWHLHKVFAKLDISSRKELHGALPDLRRPTMTGRDGPVLPGWLRFDRGNGAAAARPIMPLSTWHAWR
jgi:DNA-binding CsgD family transcriptional regulator